MRLRACSAGSAGSGSAQAECVGAWMDAHDCEAIDPSHAYVAPALQAAPAAAQLDLSSLAALASALGVPVMGSPGEPCKHNIALADASNQMFAPVWAFLVVESGWRMFAMRAARRQDSMQVRNGANEPLESILVLRHHAVQLSSAPLCCRSAGQHCPAAPGTGAAAGATAAGAGAVPGPCCSGARPERAVSAAGHSCGRDSSPATAGCAGGRGAAARMAGCLGLCR